MNIYSIGHGSVYGRDYTYSRRAQKGVYLLLLAKSRIRVTYDSRDIALPAGTLFLFDGSSSIRYSAADDYLVCDWIEFDAGGDSEFFELLEIPCNMPVQFADVGFISELMRNITSEFYSQSSHRLKMTDAMLKTLLFKADEVCRIRDRSQSSASEPHYSLLIELREKIYRYPQRKWNVDLMAADVNMSRSYFQHIYREVFGVSCMTDVINGKIEKAKEILSETGCTVSQVSAMCGYENEEHFMRQFKKIVGVTPTGYRRGDSSAEIR